jgi:1,4-dihydroxy-2-naphthoate octaprenyltransferase
LLMLRTIAQNQWPVGLLIMPIPTSWLGPARLPFLLLTPACVVLGVSCASLGPAPVSFWAAALALLGALAGHVSVNALNEVLDFKSGLDAMTVKTPFSGGSGTLPARPELLKGTWVMAMASLLVCVAVGLYFVSQQGPALLPLGLLGVLLVVAYTRAITRYPLLCLVAPGLGFGLVMVLGTQVALTGQASLAALTAALIPFFLVNNLLLLNQFPDAEADCQVGRRHLLVTAGPRVAARWYALQAALTYVCLAAAVLTQILPWGAAAGLLTLPLAYSTTRQVLKHAADAPALLSTMGRNVQITLLTPTLMALGIWLS